MGRRLAGPCSVYPCPDAGTIRGKCPRHASLGELERNKKRTASLAVYRSPQWRRFRAEVLDARPYCEHKGCNELATDVDHINTIEEGGEAFSEDNVASLCHPHHSAKTATIDRAKLSARDVTPSAYGRGKGGRNRGGNGP